MRAISDPGPGRPPGSDHGFTLVEVLAVLVILGIVLAAGIPTYRGARDRSQDAAAQQVLYDGFVAASIVYIDELDFEDADAVGLSRDEPTIRFVPSPAPSTDEGLVSVATAFSDSLWGGAVQSDSGTCFYVRTDGAGTTAYGSSDSFACTGDVALTASGNGWSGAVGVTGLEGGFQSDASIGGYWNTHGAGAVIGDEWEVVSGSVDAQVEHSSRFDYDVDGQFIDLNGGNAGHIRRTVSLVPNTPYVLTFDLGENSYGGPAVKQLEVIWNGDVIATLDVDVPALELEQISLPIPAGDATTGVLEFKSLLGSAHGPVIGNPLLTPA